MSFLRNLNVSLPFCVVAIWVLFFVGAVAEDGGITRTIPEISEIDPQRLIHGFKPEITAVRVKTPPKIDGHLDEEIWRTAPSSGPLIRNNPRPGEPMPQPSEFRVAYDDNFIYMAIWHWDSEPDEIVARYMRRDDSQRPDDYSIIVFDTFNDERNGYWFRINPNGAREDGTISNNTTLNTQWDGIWDLKTQVNQFGWFAELAFPLTTFSFDPNSQEWGLNVTRNIKRIDQRGLWASPRSSMRSYYVSEAGKLKGLSGLQQGLGLEFNPYILGTQSEDKDLGTNDFDFEWGGDFRYRITPKMSATISYNTDFASAETDARQVNLTRFSLFFPEKRRFFLEDAGVFNFGGFGERFSRRSRTSPVFLPYFSRRIGLNSSGEVVPLLGAAKLTGRVGEFDIGLINAVIDSTDELGSQNAFVGRVSRQVFDQSSVGVLATHGDPNSDYDNLLLGSDFRFLTDNFLNKYRLEANVFLLGSESDDPAFGDGLAPSFGGNVILPADEFNVELALLHIDENYNPALGFAPRRGIRRYFTNLTYQPFTESVSWLRQYYLLYDGEIVTNFSNEQESSTHTFTPVGFAFENADYAEIRIENSSDAPSEDFDISDDVSISAGDYRWTRGIINIETATRRMFCLQHEFSFGDFYDGTRTENTSELTFAPSKYFGSILAYTKQNVKLSGGDFDIKLASLTALVNFTPDFTWSNIVQYDNISDSLGVNSRLIWEYRPGKKIFLVLNQSYLDERTGFVLKQSDTTLKLSSIFRF
ncbi:MAG: DUF5916 domain-containing protein [Verrucomicrobia bacterium]|nr:DUF5916 domain-containing protein [Verrucomicrobiota bacterium]